MTDHPGTWDRMKRGGTGGSAGRCDWIGRQNLRCWVELGFCETLRSSSLEFKPIMSFLGWVERSGV